MPFQRSRALVLIGDRQSTLLLENTMTMSHPCLKPRRVFAAPARDGSRVPAAISRQMAGFVSPSAGRAMPWQDLTHEPLGEEEAEAVELFQRSFAMRGIALIVPHGLLGGLPSSPFDRSARRLRPCDSVRACEQCLSALCVSRLPTLEGAALIIGFRPAA
jgi:hypothetical protein